MSGMKKINLFDSKGKEFFTINLNPNFTFLDKQVMFQELEGAVNSVSPKRKENLRIFCENIVKFCDE